MVAWNVNDRQQYMQDIMTIPVIGDLQRGTNTVSGAAATMSHDVL